jgi:hypothetical protein
VTEKGKERGEGGGITERAAEERGRQSGAERERAGSVIWSRRGAS